MLDLILLPLQYRFFLIALAAGSLLAVCAALVGTHLTLKGFSMIGDGLSHVGFGAIAVAVSASLAPLALAVPIVVAAAFLLLRLEQKGRADSAIAMLSAASLAVGVCVVSLSGTNFDLNSYLFGSVLAISQKQFLPIVLLCLAVIVCYVLCSHGLFLLTYDETFGRACGRKMGFYKSLLAALSAVVVVVGMQSVGALLISALLIFPPSAAMRLTVSFQKTVWLAVLFSLFSFTAGLFFSFWFSLPAGAAVVLANAACYLLCLGAGKLKRQK